MFEKRGNSGPSAHNRSISERSSRRKTGEGAYPARHNYFPNREAILCQKSSCS